LHDFNKIHSCYCENYLVLYMYDGDGLTLEQSKTKMPIRERIS